MSINSCSINEYTVNTLCGRRRNAIISELQDRKNVVYVGHSQQHVSPDTKLPLQMFRRDHREEDISIEDIEMPYVTVTVELAGITSSQTIDRDDIIPLVSVSQFRINAIDEETVNISDIKIRII